MKPPIYDADAHFDGGTCNACGDRINDDNPRQDGTDWSENGPAVSRWQSAMGGKLYFRSLDGCRTCAREAAKHGAMLLLKHDALEDAFTELGDALCIPFGHVARRVA